MRPWFDNGSRALTDSEMDDVFQRIGNRLDVLEAAVAALQSPAAKSTSWKVPVIVATNTTAVSLTTPGDPIDNVTLTGMLLPVRIALCGQGDGPDVDNGIYDWMGAAIPLVRSADSATGALLWQARYAIAAGTSAGRTVQNGNNTVPIIETDPINMAIV